MQLPSAITTCEELVYRVEEIGQGWPTSAELGTISRLLGSAANVSVPIENWPILKIGQQFYLTPPFWQYEELRQPSFRYFVSSSMLWRMVGYSGITMYVVQAQKFSGLTVVDLGCADGMLAMAAAKQGAKKIIGMDNYDAPKISYEDAQEAFRWTGEINFVEAKTELIMSDFRHPLAIAHLIAAKPDVIMANIGPCYDGHMAIFNLLAHLPSVKMFIGGGYAHTYGGYTAASKYYPTQALQALEQLGFREEMAAVGWPDQGFEVFTKVGKDKTKLWPVYAFMAVR